MKQYLGLVDHVLRSGIRKENRTGVDTLSTFGFYYEIDLKYGFPLLTTKSVSWKNIVVEMLWFLSGQTDISILKRHGCKFWDAWADENGKVPSAYGNFWRQFPTHPTGADVPGEYSGERWYPRFNDQIAWVTAELKRNPMSRRMVVSAWAPENAQTSKLPPCHSIFMLNVQNGTPPKTMHYGHNEGWDPVCGAEKGTPANTFPNGSGMQEGHAWCPKCVERIPQLKNPPPPKDPRRLCLHLTQRSADVALGVPYNIASYALLTHLFSRFSGIEPGIFGHTLVDAHVYTSKPDGSMAEYDHVPGLKEQLTREPRPLPKLHISDSIRDLSDIERLMSPEVSTEEVMSHFVLEGYDPHQAIPFKVAV